MYVVYVDYIKTTNDKIIFEPDTGGTCHNPSQEAEIQMIMVQILPKEIVLQDCVFKKPLTKKSWWSGSGCMP
jgi:hypothetical protein